MFGMRHGSECEGRWAAGRGWRRRHGFGGGGPHGMGGGDLIRAGPMLATGGLRLIALALLAEQPRRAYLEQNRDFVDSVLERFAAIGEKIARMRRRLGGEDRDDRHGLPPLVQAALENLREVAAKRLEGDEDAEAKLVEILARAAQELRKA